MRRAALALSMLALFAAALPASAVHHRPAVFTFTDDDDNRWIYAFTVGFDGHLWARRYNGSTWEWIDHGLPEGATEVRHPQAVSYVDEAGKRRIYVFAVDDQGRLVSRYHKGAGYNWAWTAQGGPKLDDDVLAAQTIEDDSGVRRIFVMGVRAPDGDTPRRVTVNFWDGSAWHWMYLNAPPDEDCYHDFLEATSYGGNDGRQRMDLLCMHDRLIRYSWVAGTWYRSDLGGTPHLAATTVNLLSPEGERQVHTFTLSGNPETIWDQRLGGWRQVGAPNSNDEATARHMLAAVTYRDRESNAHMELFATWRGELYAKSWLNYEWQPWVYVGIPPHNLVSGVFQPGALTYYESRVSRRYIRVFLTSHQDHLLEAFWNGLTWQWIDHGVH